MNAMQGVCLMYGGPPVKSEQFELFNVGPEGGQIYLPTVRHTFKLRTVEFGGRVVGEDHTGLSLLKFAPDKKYIVAGEPAEGGAARQEHQGGGQLPSSSANIVLNDALQEALAEIRHAKQAAVQAIMMEASGESASSLGAYLIAGAKVQGYESFGLRDLNDPVVLSIKQQWKAAMMEKPLVYLDSKGEVVVLSDNLWEAWENATTPDGEDWLGKGPPEEGPHLQQLMTCVLQCAPREVYTESGFIILSMAHVDSHNIKTVCDAATPDSLLLAVPQEILPKNSLRPTAQAAMASNVAAIGNYKSQGGGNNGDANVYRLHQYCVSVLSKLPHSHRSSVVSYITDLRNIQLFRTARAPKGGFVMDYMSHEYEDVLGVLSSMLLANHGKMEVVTPPLLELNGQILSIQSLAGVGSQAIVYVCKAGPKLTAACVEGIPAAATSGCEELNRTSSNAIAHTAESVHVEPENLYAVKVFKASTDANELEKSILVQFSKEQPCNNGIVRMLGETSNGALVLSPVGSPLSAELLRKHPRCFEALPEFIANLKAAHQVALHSDLRYNNIILDIKPGGSLQLVVIDWGCACQHGEPAQFKGTIMYASQRVLSQLQNSHIITYTAAYDLETVVETFFALTHWEELANLRGMEGMQYAEMHKEWEDLIDDRYAWARSLEAARACEYEEVAQELFDRLQ